MKPWIIAVLALFCSSTPAQTVRRANPWKSDKAHISFIIESAEAIGVYCDAGVERETCRFFFHSFAAQLDTAGISSVLYFLPENLEPCGIEEDCPAPTNRRNASFLVPPPFPGERFGDRFLPLSATLKLIELDDGGGTELVVSGFCWQSSTASGGLRLPQWSVVEVGASSVGPLEKDRAAASHQLAKAIGEYLLEARQGKIGVKKGKVTRASKP
jgi:hypothetical protein